MIRRMNVQMEPLCLKQKTIATSSFLNSELFIFYFYIADNLMFRPPLTPATPVRKAKSLPRKKDVKQEDEM